ncbi:uncharacterized protein LOC130990878 [Salvia miltiorrhiza]|uniref:uncharacterized protein LOC130990878 n=1 Tax=Salvia miltiorrhiza TaxID=226208 RepID=UPI0025AC33E7|nr:uncharacterized protein LOC130990878 [Salvia miltiorrhiza]
MAANAFCPQIGRCFCLSLSLFHSIAQIWEVLHPWLQSSFPHNYRSMNQVSVIDPSLELLSCCFIYGCIVHQHLLQIHESMLGGKVSTAATLSTATGVLVIPLYCALTQWLTNALTADSLQSFCTNQVYVVH